MKSELVSVIMPAYNAEKFISMSITSVLQQTYKRIELIIVDDGSTDNTVGKVSVYVNNWPEIIKLLIRKENGGVAAALNDAIELTKGKYICWLSADDLYCRDMIESELNFLEENGKYDAVFSRCAHIDENNQFIKVCGYDESFEKQMEDRSVIISALLHRNFWHGCTVLAKAECFKHGGGFNLNYRASQDYDFWLRMAADYEIGYLNKVNVLSREHSGQGSKKMNCNLDEIKVFFDMLYREDVVIKLLKKMKLDYSLKNIKPYILSRIVRYRELEEETELLKYELMIYYDMIEKGHIHFAD